MEHLQRISRRLFLRDLGSKTFGLAVLSSGVLAACSSAGDVAVATSTRPEGEDLAATTTVPEGRDDTEVDDSLRWTRVILGSVSAYLLGRGNEIAVVDTGTRGSGDDIAAALFTMGADWSNVSHVVLTHLHGDHVGSLPEVLEAAPRAVAYAGTADIAGISSPREIRPLDDGDEVFGLQVIGTPGHTPGHISVLDPVAGFLVAGDALNESGGMILGPNPSFTPDMDTANASVKRLAERQFETVVFGHGNPFEGEASEAVIALAQTL